MSHQILLGSILRLGVKGHHGLRIVILVLIVAAIVVAFVLVRQRRQSHPTPANGTAPPGFPGER